jgi:hypothetical protein
MHMVEGIEEEKRIEELGDGLCVGEEGRDGLM